MRTTFNVNFYCRESKKTKSGKAPIEVSIIINGERVMLSLPRKEDPKKFSKPRGELKEYLEIAYLKILNYQTDLLKQNVPVTASSIKKFIQNGFSTSITIEQVFEEYIKLLSKRVNVNLSYSSYKKYLLIRDKFFEYVNPNNDITTITNSVITNFYAELNKKYNSGTSGSMMTKLKTIITYAIANDWLHKDPFNGVKISKKYKTVYPLTEEELSRIKGKELHCERLNRVRDLFLFQCFTGLSYSDMYYLEKEDFKKNGDQIYIQKQRCKTGVEYTTILLNDAISIIEKYDYKLPVLTNQRYNSYLKEIADLCGITKPLHSHIARHTFATYLLNKGISIETVSKVLGHSNTKITAHYAKLLNKTLFAEIATIS